MKIFVQHFLYLNFWIAAGAALLSAESFYLSGIPVDFIFTGFVFFSTLFIYNLQRYFISSDFCRETTSHQKVWVCENRGKVKTVFLFALIPAFGFFLLLENEIKLWVIPSSVCALLYSVGKNTSIRGWRNIPFVKIILLSVTWGYITGFMPSVYSPADGGWMLFAAKTLFIFSLYIPFEIRDMYYDSRAMKTIPQVLGVKGSLLAGIISVSLYAFISTMQFIPIAAGVTILIITVSALVLSSQKRKEWFYLGFVDSVIIAKPLFSFLSIALL